MGWPARPPTIKPSCNSWCGGTYWPIGIAYREYPGGLLPSNRSYVFELCAQTPREQATSEKNWYCNDRFFFLVAAHRLFMRWNNIFPVIYRQHMDFPTFFYVLIARSPDVCSTPHLTDAGPDTAKPARVFFGFSIIIYLRARPGRVVFIKLFDLLSGNLERGTVKTSDAAR